MNCVICKDGEKFIMPVVMGKDGFMDAPICRHCLESIVKTAAQQIAPADSLYASVKNQTYVFSRILEELERSR